jgi:Glycosyl transferase family 2
MKSHNSVTVVLNVFRRAGALEEQLSALRKQTVPVERILVWENGEDAVPEHLRSGLVISRASENLGVWARFAFALNAETEYLLMLDDDTIPGARWIENCIATMEKTPGLLGTRGLIFVQPESYSINVEAGVHAPNEDTVEVDIVGHAWFFKRAWLSAYWSEYSNKFPEMLAGEDIHFSFAIQKNLGLPTLVPPHPADDLTLWGSIPDRAVALGTSQEAISKGSGAMKKFERALKHYRKLGFQVLSERRPEIKLNSQYPRIIYILAAKYPDFFHWLAAVAPVRSYLSKRSSR